MIKNHKKEGEEKMSFNEYLESKKVDICHMTEDSKFIWWLKYQNFLAGEYPNRKENRK